MGLCDGRNRKRADGGLFHRVPGKQKKPGKPTISGFPGIDTKTALRFGRLFLYERLFLNMVRRMGFEPTRRIPTLAPQASAYAIPPPSHIHKAVLTLRMIVYQNRCKMSSFNFLFSGVLRKMQKKGKIPPCNAA